MLTASLVTLEATPKGHPILGRGFSGASGGPGEGRLFEEERETLWEIQLLSRRSLCSSSDFTPCIYPNDKTSDC